MTGKLVTVWATASYPSTAIGEPHPRVSLDSPFTVWCQTCRSLELQYTTSSSVLHIRLGPREGTGQTARSSLRRCGLVPNMESRETRPGFSSFPIYGVLLSWVSRFCWAGFSARAFIWLSLLVSISKDGDETGYYFRITEPAITDVSLWKPGFEYSSATIYLGYSVRAMIPGLVTAAVAAAKPLALSLRYLPTKSLIVGTESAAITSYCPADSPIRRRERDELEQQRDLTAAPLDGLMRQRRHLQQLN